MRHKHTRTAGAVATVLVLFTTPLPAGASFLRDVADGFGRVTQKPGDKAAAVTEKVQVSAQDATLKLVVHSAKGRRVAIFYTLDGEDGTFRILKGAVAVIGDDGTATLSADLGKLLEQAKKGKKALHVRLATATLQGKGFTDVRATPPGAVSSTDGKIDGVAGKPAASITAETAIKGGSLKGGAIEAPSVDEAAPKRVLAAAALFPGDRSRR